MSGGWAGSQRASRLPANWAELKRQVRQRSGGRCEVVEDGARCTQAAAQCDHIVAGDDHSLPNLRDICIDHHKVKSSREGSEARWRYREQRPSEPHPGLR